MGRYRQWGSWTERGVILNVDGMLRVAEERTLAGRLFQMVEAAGRKPRVPNDKLHRVTDNRLAEADRKVRQTSLDFTAANNDAGGTSDN